uniref:Uncharacterized protein n=1 Tax=Paramormyrops kingsleyae TaxID=1676925 RepID=A0A3B3S5A8_9TELE
MTYSKETPATCQLCTIERRGFRQELDSWRHKLTYSVGIGSALEGLFHQEVFEDIDLLQGRSVLCFQFFFNTISVHICRY